LTWKFSRPKNAAGVAAMRPRVWKRGSGARCAPESVLANPARLGTRRLRRAVARSVLAVRRALFARPVARAFDATRATNERNARNSGGADAPCALAPRSLHRRKAPSREERDARSREANRPKRAGARRKTRRSPSRRFDSIGCRRARSSASLEGARAMKLHPTRATLC